MRLTNSAGSTTSSASAPPASWNDLRRHEHGAQRADRRRTFRSGSGHTRERVVGGAVRRGRVAAHVPSCPGPSKSAAGTSSPSLAVAAARFRSR